MTFVVVVIMLAMARARGHQLRREAEDDLTEHPRRSKLARHLYEEFAFGLKSATECQTLAALSMGDHDESPQELVDLAKIGNRG